MKRKTGDVLARTAGEASLGSFVTSMNEVKPIPAPISTVDLLHFPVLAGEPSCLFETDSISPGSLLHWLCCCDLYQPFIKMRHCIRVPSSQSYSRALAHPV